MRIQIIGYSNAGKSKFAQELSKILGIEATHIDRLYWLSNWVEADEEVVNEKMDEIIKRDKWIIDGNYSRFCPERIELCDILFLFKFNRIRCLYNAVKRRIKYHKKTRPSITEGCDERLDFEFVKWLLKDGRKKGIRQRYKMYQNNYHDKIITFKSHKDVKKWLKQFENNI